MTTDAVWNGGMGTLAYLLERRKGKGKESGMARCATGKIQRAAQRTRGKPLLSCRRDRSPASVIAMRTWLALAGVLPAAFVFKWSCLPLPGPAKVGQDGLGTGKTQQPEIVAGTDSRLRVLYPAALPCQMEPKKENG